MRQKKYLVTGFVYVNVDACWTRFTVNAEVFADDEWEAKRKAVVDLVDEKEGLGYDIDWLQSVELPVGEDYYMRLENQPSLFDT